MKAIVEFIKATVVGGLLIVVPLYFALLLLAKAIAGIIALLAPVTAALPESLHAFRSVAAIVLLVAVCFVFGLAARTRPGKRLFTAFEVMVLERIPGYSFLRDVTRRLSGQSTTAAFQPVMVEIEDALTPAFIVEELDDARYVVLVPSVPTPMAGAIYVLPRERVHFIDATVTETVGVITRWGSGTGNLLKTLR
jgi:uncharacterized membrane protein